MYLVERTLLQLEPDCVGKTLRDFFVDFGRRQVSTSTVILEVSSTPNVKNLKSWFIFES